MTPEQNRIIQEYIQFKNQILQFRLELIRHLVLVASAVLAVVVSVASGAARHNLCLRSTLVLLLASVLFGVLSLYFHLFQLRKMDKAYPEHVSRNMRTGEEKPLLSSYDKTLRFFEAISLLSFLAAMVLLVLYALS